MEQTPKKKPNYYHKKSSNKASNNQPLKDSNSNGTKKVNNSNNKPVAKNNNSNQNNKLESNKQAYVKKDVVTNKPKKQTKSKQVDISNDKEIKVFSLGGIGVIGMNMYIIEQGDEIIIIDAGILFADDDVHGVNYIMPDFTYLEQNEKKIVGLFITHGHEDHIGAIPFLLKKVNIKTIYSTGLGIGLIRNKMLEFPDIPYNLKEYHDDTVIKTKNFEISFFRTHHSIPDSYGIAIKTYLGYIVDTGDFKFDFSPVGEPSDYYDMARLGNEGVYCLLSESTNADIAEFSSSEMHIGKTLLDLFNQIDGRLIVATFASNVYRVQQIIEASIASGRKVYTFGHSMDLTIQVASKMGYIKYPPGWVINARDLKTVPEEKITILCTGSQGEPLAALSRIASGTHKQIKLLPDDTIIYSSKPIPGNEQFINRNINKLVHRGAHVIINGPLSDTHTTGHASQTELKLMLSLMRPKYLIPVHGEYRMLVEHVELATEVGIKKENCFILKPGDVVSFNGNKPKVLHNAVPVNDVYLDQGLSDVDSSILKERKKMADDGIVSVTLFINKKHNIINKPLISINGFAATNLQNSLINSFQQKCTDFYKTLTNGKEKFNINGVEKNISKSLAQYIYSRMDMKPLINIKILQVNVNE